MINVVSIYFYNSVRYGLSDAIKLLLFLKSIAYTVRFYRYNTAACNNKLLVCDCISIAGPLALILSTLI